MSWIFGIAAEFGSDKEAAAQFAQFFNQQSNLPLQNGGVRSFLDSDGAYWVHVWGSPTQKEEICKHNLEDLALMAGGFRFALAGTETDEFRTYSELQEDLGSVFFDGLLISAAVYQYAEQPAGFVPVSPNFWKATPPTPRSPLPSTAESE